MKQAFTIDDEALASLYPGHLESLRARFDRALDRAGASHAVIFSGAPLGVFLDDYTYPYKANPHFVSWLPLTNLPHSYLIYTSGEKPVLVYYQERDYWHSPPQDPAGYWTAYFDIRVVADHDEVAAHLPTARDKCVLIGELSQASQSQGIERVNPTTVMNVLHYGRGVKTDYEIECTRQASRRAVAGHRAAEAAFRNGAPEFDIHLAYCRAVDHGDNELPYGNIVALNRHGAVLHYQHLEREAPEQIRSFLIDAGAQVHRYASDITRTYAFDDNEFATLIDAFDDLQQGIVGEVRAGANFADLHLLTHHRIAEFLAAQGFASGSPEALIQSGVTSAFYPHGLGHLLGVQVHDVGGLMADDSGNVIDRPSGHGALRLTRTLEADMIVTVEPGIYVIDILLDDLGADGKAMLDMQKVDALRPFGGIRIEDDVRVLPDGSENLTRDAFAAAA